MTNPVAVFVLGMAFGAAPFAMGLLLAWLDAQEWNDAEPLSPPDNWEQQWQRVASRETQRGQEILRRERQS